MPNFIKSLYLSEYDKLFAHAFGRLRNREDAEDAVQSVFLACLQYPQHVKNADNRGGYLMTMLKHEISRVYRQRDFAGDTEVANSQPPAPCFNLIESECCQMIRNALAQVTPCHHQRAFRLYHDGSTLDDIAVEMRCSKKQVESYIRQAKIKLRRILDTAKGDFE